MTRRWREASEVDERGSAVIWVLCCALLVWSGGLAALTRGAAVIARHRAESVADLAALAAARIVLRGSGDGCARAAEVAAGNRARMVGCQIAGDGSVLVTAEVSGPGWGRLDLPPARAQARAGGSWSSGGGGPGDQRVTP